MGVSKPRVVWVDSYIYMRSSMICLKEWSHHVHRDQSSSSYLFGVRWKRTLLPIPMNVAVPVYRKSTRATPGWPKLGERWSEAKCVSKWRLHLRWTCYSYLCERMVTVLRSYPACIAATGSYCRNLSSPDFLLFPAKNHPANFLCFAQKRVGYFFCSTS